MLIMAKAWWPLGLGGQKLRLPRKVTGLLPVSYPIITNGSKRFLKPRSGLSPQGEAEGLLGFNGFLSVVVILCA